MADLSRSSTTRRAFSQCHPYINKAKAPRKAGLYIRQMPSADGIVRRLRLAFHFFQTVERRF